MQTWIALFRGINVGGNNILPMADLKRYLESLGLNNVRTYIQSGNVVFDSTASDLSSLSETIARHIEEQQGFIPQILLLSPKDLLKAIESNPFSTAVSDPKTLHFGFLAEPATNPDTSALDEIRASTERYKLIDSVFYLHAPDGIGRSKLAANAEKHLGVVMTVRNYRTVDKLREMVMKKPEKSLG